MKPTSAPLPFALGVVILAAGRSARMGQPKLLLPWDDTTVIGHLIRQWQTLRAQCITAVCAPGDHVMRHELERLVFPAEHVIENPTPERGMFSSIQCASRWPEWPGDLTHWAIVLGDQPHLRVETLERVLGVAAYRPDQIVQPSRDRHGRHPVIIPKALFSELGSTAAATLKEFLTAKSRQIMLCEVNDPGFDLDVDCPEDYAKALALRPR